MALNRAALQHRPFLTPIWLTAFGALVVVCTLSFAAWFWGTADSTTIVVVRHAEKELNAGDDPPLTAAGKARATSLARMFGGGQPGAIDAIYVSPTTRNRMTAAPLAARLGLTPIEVPAGDAGALARRILREHGGQRILVVGHSNTVPLIVEALSGAKSLPPITDDEYGTLYVITVPRIGRADFLRLSY
jgi:broad specificity phosphatase PhoE